MITYHIERIWIDGVPGWAVTAYQCGLIVGRSIGRTRRAALAEFDPSLMESVSDDHQD